MRSLPSQLLLTSSLFVLALAGGCGCGKDENKDVRTAFQQNQIQPGTYASERCFLNKIETQTATSNRYSRATVVFDTNHSGTGRYLNYSDAACTVFVSDQTFTFVDAGLVSIGGVSVIRFQQSGTVINPTWWIPANLSDTGYSLDVDFTDGESGPYITEPSAATLASFGQNPGQGVSFARQ